MNDSQRKVTAAHWWETFCLEFMADRFSLSSTVQFQCIIYKHLISVNGSTNFRGNARTCSQGTILSSSAALRTTAFRANPSA